VRELFAHDDRAPEHTMPIAPVIAPVAERTLGAPTAGPVHGSEKSPSAVPSPSARSPFAELVRALGHEAERGEATVRRVLSAGAGNLGPSDLLALQAGIYRYGETVDLAAKLVDKAGTDVRTVLQGQQ
jgi:hypothetical protein